MDSCNNVNICDTVTNSSYSSESDDPLDDLLQDIFDIADDIKSIIDQYDTFLSRTRKYDQIH